ncbi:MAG TPA: DUF2058 family protein, partial [Aggregicoccus sp.]|nr:DUF2058 family protein [Aggregicoccus sp.]
MQNLRDKLLKAGLVTEDQAKKVETSAPSRPAPASQPRREEARGPRRDDHRPRRDEGRGPPPRREGGRPPHGRAPAAAAPPVPKLPPMPGSREAQRLESKKQQELARALRELVAGNQVPIDVGASVFYFMTRKGKLRRLELTEAQAKQLEDGTLAVVERPEPAQIEHSLVPAAAAEQMYALSQKSVRFLNRKDAPIGFMDDSELKAQQDAEAAGTIEETPDEETPDEQTPT